MDLNRNKYNVKRNRKSSISFKFIYFINKKR